MAFNIMDMVLKQITPDNISAVASMLGEDQNKVGSAISGAAPALLGGLVSSLSKPEGTKAFEQQLEQADPGLMGNLVGMLGGDGGSALLKTGAGMLSSMFGDSKTDMLASALSSFSGLSSGASKSLLGLATPMLMGMLKGKSKSDNLNTGGLVDMLMGQKDNIASAMPSQMATSLSGSGLLDGVMAKAGAGATAAAATTAAAGREAAAVSREAADKGGSFLGKLLPIIILAIVAWLAYQFFLKPDPQPGNAVPGSSVGAVQLTDQLGDLMGKAGTILAGIDSADEASNALGQLQTVDQGLGQLLNAAANLPAAQTQKLAASFNQLAPQLEQAVSHAYSVPGAREVLSDSVDSILRKLKVVAGG
jgi:hypothetical protein